MKIKIKKKLKIVFVGTTNFSKKYLEALIKSKYKITKVITKRKFFKKKYISEVEKVAKKNFIKVISKINLENSKIIKEIKKENPDIMIIVAYGIKIPKNIIKIFPLKAINIHPSILPKWKGPSPIQRAILNGDKKTGISIILINQKIDSGNILYKKTCKIEKKDTFLSLSKKLCNIGIKCMFLTLKNIHKKKEHKQKNIKNNNLYAYKIKKLETKLIWSKSAKSLERSIRAFFPKPASYFIYKKKRIKVMKSKIFFSKKKYLCGKIINVLKNGIYIGTKKNCLIINKIQLEGKKIINSVDIYNGYKNFFKIGDIIK
ncbi:methionyl-tRNA formyltransferase [Buchnera aphidicola (Ceratovacuna keduensis)]|uniref:methionyl-tRNA formyltransferase n=1 Tax=Buchnera aphidicola TaxID=9 RepID=UPI0031B80A7D